MASSNPESPHPQPVVELAQGCVRYVRETLELELDYTPETLPILDHYLRTRVDPSHTEIIELLAPTAGCYFGEVVRRSFGGTRWHSPEGDFPAHRVEFEGFFLHFNPIGIALEVLTQEDAPGWRAHFQVLDDVRAEIEASFGATQNVRAEDYYTLSVRYETLEQIAGHLAARVEHDPNKRTHFGRDVYRAFCS